MERRVEALEEERRALFAELEAALARRAACDLSRLNLMITVSSNIDLGQIASIVSVLGGGLCVAVMNIASIHGLKDDVKEVKDEMKKISTILANQAAYDVRLATLEAEVMRLRTAHP